MEEKVIAIEELVKKNMSIVTSIQELSEDEKKELLRRRDFVNKLNSSQLEVIINSLNFMDAFNMLQNKELLEKIKHINIKLKSKDALFVKDFLEFIPVAKIQPEMMFNMLRALPKYKVIEYITDYQVFGKLTENYFMDLAIIKRINLFELYDGHNILNEELAYKYIDRYFRATLDYKIIDNPTAKKILFDDPELDLAETRYLYDYLTTQNNHSIKDINHSLKAFIKVNSLHDEFGLEETIQLFNTKGITIDDIFTFKKHKRRNKKR